ncbi:MAG TPA: pyridoxamine 5'-phosphate oxidase [Aggregicoccus sp.]|nr:pyridoxamine 5'-phosphate oxidase [Aggregicoccus sp.]
MDLPFDPFERFAALYEQARAAIPVDPNAMVLATVGPDGQPSARVVLLKDFDARGFVFYTNLQSRKGEDLLAHPQAALVVHWVPLERQVRIEGRAERVSDEEADAYFQSRPRGSQVGAWASAQSRPLASREQLEARVEELTRQYEGREVPRPPHWSGFRLVPTRIEFWHARQSRLHERIAYTREREGSPWRTEMLNP